MASNERDCCARWSTCKWNGKRMSPFSSSRQSVGEVCCSSGNGHYLPYLVAQTHQWGKSDQEKSASLSFTFSRAFLSLPSDHAPTDLRFSSAYWESVVHHKHYLHRKSAKPYRTPRRVCSACHTGIILLIIQKPLVHSTIHSSHHDQQSYCLPTMKHSPPKRHFWEGQAKGYSQSGLLSTLFPFSLALALKPLRRRWSEWQLKNGLARWKHKLHLHYQNII